MTSVGACNPKGWVIRVYGISYKASSMAGRMWWAGEASRFENASDDKTGQVYARHETADR